jgi:hypothetical protein
MAWRSPGTWLAPALLTASLYDAALAEHDLALALAREAHEPGEHAERCPRCGSPPLYDCEPEDESCWTCGWEPAP